MYVGPAGAALSSQVQEVLPLPLVGHSGGGEGGGGEGGGGLGGGGDGGGGDGGGGLGGGGLGGGGDGGGVGASTAEQPHPYFAS